MAILDNLIIIGAAIGAVIVIGAPIGVLIWYFKTRKIKKNAKLQLEELKKREVEERERQIEAEAERERREVKFNAGKYYNPIITKDGKADIGQGKLPPPIEPKNSTSGGTASSEGRSSLPSIPSDSTKITDRGVKKHKQKFKLHKPNDL